jgi:hypothetical protein
MRRKPLLSFDEAYNAVALWGSRERQLAEVRSMFAKKEITNLTRIRLNQKLVNDRTEGLARKRTMKILVITFIVLNLICLCCPFVPYRWNNAVLAALLTVIYCTL